ncbi:hypothetical protein ACRWFY_13680 [Escherichia coli]|uniref:hypothetical protein n=1 Tax=Escherichia coli TaxID=562 RepID=UPI001FCE9AB9|nr:hypothetical protein [Escherichia coli]
MSGDSGSQSTENEKITSVDVEDWTPERRFSVVLETATLSEMEIADYCRRMGLFVEQVKEWRAISIQAHEKKLTENIRTDRALRDAKNKLRELEKELKRKDKALAEAAALLILREKFNALWDNSEEDCPLSWSGVKLLLLSARPSPTAHGKVRLVGVSVFLFGHFSAGLMATLSLRTEDPIL